MDSPSPNSGERKLNKEAVGSDASTSAGSAANTPTTNNRSMKSPQGSKRSIMKSPTGKKRSIMKSPTGKKRSIMNTPSPSASKRKLGGKKKKYNSKTLEAATQTEIWSWMFFDFANSSFYQVLTGVFIQFFFLFVGEQVACPYGYNINETTAVSSLWSTPTYTNVTECLSVAGCSNISSRNVTVENYKMEDSGNITVSIHGLQSFIDVTKLDLEVLDSSNPYVVNTSGVKYNGTEANVSQSTAIIHFTPASDWVTGECFITWKLSYTQGGSLIWNTTRTSYVKVIKSTRICKERMYFFGSDIEIETYPAYTVGISVVCQVFFFVTIVSFADFGNYRKIICTYSYILCSLLVIITPFFASDPRANYNLIATLHIFQNVLFGVAIIMYNSQLPFLAKVHKTVRGLIEKGAKATEIVAQYDKMVEYLGAYGMMVGYVGGLSSLIICIGIGLFMQGNLYLYYIIVFVLTGTWMLVFATPYFLFYKSREGAALPKSLGGGKNFLKTLFFSWGRFANTLENLAILPEHLKFVIGYFIYTDSYTTCTKVGVVFAVREMNMTFMEVTALGIIVPLMAFVGIGVSSWIRKFTKSSALSMIRKELVFMIIFPIAGLIGFIPASPIGIKQKWEMYFFAACLGACLGSVENHSRIAFTDFIPPGQTSEYFGLFEITDKGSAWMGPLITGYMFTALGSIRYGFFYLGGSMVVAQIIMWTIDERKALQDATSLKVAIALKNMKKKRDQMKFSVTARFLSVADGISSSFSRASSASSFVASTIASQASSTNSSIASSAASVLSSVQDDDDNAIEDIDLDDVDQERLKNDLAKGADGNTSAEQLKTQAALLEAMTKKGAKIEMQNKA